MRGWLTPRLSLSMETESRVVAERESEGPLGRGHPLLPAALFSVLYDQWGRGKQPGGSQREAAGPPHPSACQVIKSCTRVGCGVKETTGIKERDSPSQCLVGSTKEKRITGEKGPIPVLHGDRRQGPQKAVPMAYVWQRMALPLHRHPHKPGAHQPP